MDEEVASPCINVCVMNERTGFCAGCLRTLDEIAGWGNLPNDAKREILLRIKARGELIRQSQYEKR